MADQRIKGQEVQLIITSGEDLEAELTDVKSCEFTPQFETKEDGFLGEKANRFDDIYNGIKGTITMHFHSGDLFDFIQKIKQRAQRSTPDRIFSITGVFVFPSGDIKSLTCPDVFFGPVPISTNDRGDFVEAKFEFAGSDFRVEQE